MKALFNGTCAACKEFKPRCATVYMRIAGTDEYESKPAVLCLDCRARNNKLFKVAEQHRSEAK